MKSKIPSDLLPKSDETWQEMRARHEKQNQDSGKVFMIVLCLILFPFVGCMLISALDRAFS